jgi:hypothetical protein
MLAVYSTSGPGTLVPPTNLDPFPYAKGQLANVNSSGDYAFTESPGLSPDPNRRAERGHGLTLTPLFPQYGTSAATWINNAGEITGWVDRTNSGLFTPLTAFVYGRSGVTYLPQLQGGVDMTPTGINNRGDVVGATRIGLFFYSHGVTKAIASDINISGQSTPGLSERDEFVAVDNDNKEFLLSPSR